MGSGLSGRSWEKSLWGNQAFELYLHIVERAFSKFFSMARLLWIRAFHCRLLRIPTFYTTRNMVQFIRSLPGARMGPPDVLVPWLAWSGRGKCIRILSHLWTLLPPTWSFYGSFDKNMIFNGNLPKVWIRNVRLPADCERMEEGPDCTAVESFEFFLLNHHFWLSTLVLWRSKKWGSEKLMDNRYYCRILSTLWAHILIFFGSHILAIIVWMTRVSLLRWLWICFLQCMNWVELWLEMCCRDDFVWSWVFTASATIFRLAVLCTNQEWVS